MEERQIEGKRNKGKERKREIKRENEIERKKDRKRERIDRIYLYQFIVAMFR